MRKRNLGVRRCLGEIDEERCCSSTLYPYCRNKTCRSYWYSLSDDLQKKVVKKSNNPLSERKWDKLYGKVKETLAEAAKKEWDKTVKSIQALH